MSLTQLERCLKGMFVREIENAFGTFPHESPSLGIPVYLTSCRYLLDTDDYLHFLFSQAFLNQLPALTFCSTT
jgi:hypothetical protein